MESIKSFSANLAQQSGSNSPLHDVLNTASQENKHRQDINNHPINNQHISSSSFSDDDQPIIPLREVIPTPQGFALKSNRNRPTATVMTRKKNEDSSLHRYRPRRQYKSNTIDRSNTGRSNTDRSKFTIDNQRDDRKFVMNESVVNELGPVYDRSESQKYNSNLVPIYDRSIHSKYSSINKNRSNHTRDLRSGNNPSYSHRALKSRHKSGHASFKFPINSKDRFNSSNYNQDEWDDYNQDEWSHYEVSPDNPGSYISVPVINSIRINQIPLSSDSQHSYLSGNSQSPSTKSSQISMNRSNDFIRSIMTRQISLSTSTNQSSSYSLMTKVKESNDRLVTKAKESNDRLVSPVNNQVQITTVKDQIRSKIGTIRQRVIDIIDTCQDEQERINAIVNRFNRLEMPEAMRIYNQEFSTVQPSAEPKRHYINTSSVNRNYDITRIPTHQTNLSKLIPKVNSDHINASPTGPYVNENTTSQSAEAVVNDCQEGICSIPNSNKNIYTATSIIKSIDHANDSSTHHSSIGESSANSSTLPNHTPSIDNKPTDDSTESSTDYSSNNDSSADNSTLINGSSTNEPSTNEPSKDDTLTDSLTSSTNTSTDNSSNNDSSNNDSLADNSTEVNHSSKISLTKNLPNSSSTQNSYNNLSTQNSYNSSLTHNSPNNSLTQNLSNSSLTDNSPNSSLTQNKSNSSSIDHSSANNSDIVNLSTVKDLKRSVNSEGSNTSSGLSTNNSSKILSTNNLSINNSTDVNSSLVDDSSTRTSFNDSSNTKELKRLSIQTPLKQPIQTLLKQPIQTPLKQDSIKPPINTNRSAIVAKPVKSNGHKSKIENSNSVGVNSKTIKPPTSNLTIKPPLQINSKNIKR